MSLDKLVQEDLVAFRKKGLEYFKAQHPHIFSIVNSIFSGRKNKVGLQVTEQGAVVGKYTFILDGIDIAEVKGNLLDSEVHHPLLGTVRPYITIERGALEKMIGDERFFTNLFSTIAEYLSDLTIRFLPN